MTEPPSDATRFATRPKQRAKENLNATDNEMAKLRRETIAKAIAAGPERGWAEMVAGMWRQWAVDDHRTLDPESVAEQFAATERRLSNAIAVRALIAQAGLNHD